MAMTGHLPGPDSGFMDFSSARQGRLATPADRRWLVLLVVAVAQLMVVLDATVVNIALPSAQHALGVSNNYRQWGVTCYALAFGGLLLLGGRIGDMFSRQRVRVTGLSGSLRSSARPVSPGARSGDMFSRQRGLIIGLAGFAVAHAIGGAGVSFPM